MTPNRTSLFGEHTTSRFTGVTLADIKEFRFQARRYEWVEFRKIVLPPAAPALER